MSFFGQFGDRQFEKDVLLWGVVAAWQPNSSYLCFFCRREMARTFPQLCISIAERSKKVRFDRCSSLPADTMLLSTLSMCCPDVAWLWSKLSLHSCFYNFLYLNWVCLKLRYIPSRLAISIGTIMMIHQHSGHRTFPENPFCHLMWKKHIDKPNNLRIHEPICELVSFS